MKSWPAPPRIERYPLPPLPAPEVVRSNGHNDVSYEHDLWELQYVPHRWLERVSDVELITRYQHLVRNRRTFVGPRCDARGIDDYRSSWYWFRKDFITRLEFAMRGLELPSVHKVETPQGTPPRVPHGEVLYRFGQRAHMLELMSGKVRFSPAKTYTTIENDEARQDEETAKHAYSAGQHVRVILPDGQSIPILGNLKTSVAGPGYHMACFTREWDPQFLQAFGDTCVVVHDIDEFARRVGEAGQTVFPCWYWIYTDAEYFDPYERPRGHKLRTAISKDFLFAYQREYRFFWDQLGASPIDGVQYVDIGPTDGLLSIYDRNGNSL